MREETARELWLAGARRDGSIYTHSPARLSLEQSMESLMAAHSRPPSRSVAHHAACPRACFRRPQQQVTRSHSGGEQTGRLSQFQKAW